MGHIADKGGGGWGGGGGVNYPEVCALNVTNTEIIMWNQYVVVNWVKKL